MNDQVIAADVTPATENKSGHRFEFSVYQHMWLGVGIGVGVGVGAGVGVGVGVGVRGRGVGVGCPIHLATRSNEIILL